eukprot:5047339-Pleurochrysis_carterae.AAC.1
MLTHCEQMCQHCEVRRNRDVPSSGGAVAQQVMKDPPFPFHTVSIDHKTVTAPRGTKYLVMKDPPFSFHTVSIDHKTVTASRGTKYQKQFGDCRHADTLRHRGAGSDYVGRGDFHHIDDSRLQKGLLPDGDQVRPRSSVFRNEIPSAFASYAGLRRAFVFPYNAPANGMAEQAVARTSRLLVRHTQQFRNWPDTLPMVTFALNSTDHLSTGVSPFFA